MNATPKTYISLVDATTLAVVFPYNDEILTRIRALQTRKWNASARRWEVGIAHLHEVIDILSLDPATIDRKIMRAYQMFKIRHGRVRITADNVEAQISGAHLPLEKIARVTSLFVPGYKFMARFKKGSWDGRRHLFNRTTNRFPSGLIWKVCKALREEGSECDVVWPEEPPKVNLARLSGPLARSVTLDKRDNIGTGGSVHGDGKPPPARETRAATKLRKYQKACLETALKEKRGIIEIATGGGKTLIAANLIRAISRPTLFVVHTRDLLYQTLNVLERELGYAVGYAGDGKLELKPVTVATVQTCARSLDIKIDTAPDGVSLAKDKPLQPTAAEKLRYFIQTVQVAIFDECHHLPTETAYSVAAEMRGAHWRYGLSATPYRADRMDLLMEAALGPKIFSARASELIEQGYLVPPRIKFLSVPPFVIRSGQMDYQELYRAYIVENRRRNRLIVNAAKEQAKLGKTVLILVTQVTHGERLREMLGNAPLLRGSMPMDERRRVLAALEEKKYPIVIATTLADEGLDVPTLDCVIVASAGKSETRVLQRIGRALRPSPGKDSAMVLDFMDDAPYLREHASDRLELYKTERRFILES